MRTERQGEALVDSISRDGLATLLGGLGQGIDDAAIDQLWKGFTSEEGAPRDAGHGRLARRRAI